MLVPAEPARAQQRVVDDVEQRGLQERVAISAPADDGADEQAPRRHDFVEVDVTGGVFACEVLHEGGDFVDADDVDAVEARELHRKQLGRGGGDICVDPDRAEGSDNDATLLFRSERWGGVR